MWLMGVRSGDFAEGLEFLLVSGELDLTDYLKGAVPLVPERVPHIQLLAKDLHTPGHSRVPAHRRRGRQDRMWGTLSPLDWQRRRTAGRLRLPPSGTGARGRGAPSHNNPRRFHSQDPIPPVRGQLLRRWSADSSLALALVRHERTYNWTSLRMCQPGRIVSGSISIEHPCYYLVESTRNGSLVGDGSVVAVWTVVSPLTHSHHKVPEN